MAGDAGLLSVRLLSSAGGAVNYYAHHLGDYMRDTAHLSLLEEGVYRRLLDQYYIRERALPSDVKACCKLARAASKIERDAVESVLREFFDPQDSGWVHARCEKEIARFRLKQDKARASANARWSHDDDDANAYANALPTQSEGNALQEPIANNQSKRPRRVRGVRLPDDFVPDRESAMAAIPDLDYGAEVQRFRDYWTAKSGANATKLDWPATWRNWLRTCKDSGRYAKAKTLRVVV
jgi:uncharacterized protein YdaU (DUF1376 family)